MKLNNNKADWYTDIQFIPLQEDSWLQNQRVAGKTVAQCLAHCKKLIETQDGFTTNFLNEECAKIIANNNCTATFLNYKGFPGHICTSVNNEMVHGIPSDKVIKSGDVVKVDLGATFNGAIADAAITAICKTPKLKSHERLSQYCKESLDKAIASIAIGKQLGIIGHTISKHVQLSGGHLITNYGGHGIGFNTPHCQPFVANKARYSDGVRFKPGMVIAIEPMLSLKSNKTRVLKDKWTVVTEGISVHWEHSLYIHEDRVEILTKWDEL